MLLPILPRVTNVISSFSLPCTFISVKSAEAFKFTNLCCQGLVFEDDFIKLTVMLGDFWLDLLQIWEKKEFL